ncbi:hypothetical protein CLV92_108145 [Kineococcus xinjiangensis]|uniref:Uncharacterized protein n=1 Tax=Kineococcus xinjiangensis TaxID=512762 RepID=A0A2S6IJ44_9ACTN|nr:hypothetical protein [Kineococcus xinjiangensis]PPK94243.1 hypothetical protein CLV92_108145 [Kineococcus xinjiangensis]
MSTDVLAPSTPASSSPALRPAGAPPAVVRRRPALVEEQDRRVLATLTPGDREFLRATTGAPVAEGRPLPPLAFHVARDRRSRALAPGQPLSLGYLHHLVEVWGLALTAGEFGNALRYVRWREVQIAQQAPVRPAQSAPRPAEAGRPAARIALPA